MARTQPRLTIKQILAWADAHHKRTGKWPISRSGPVLGAGRTWESVNDALRRGPLAGRGGGTLTKLLRKYRRAGDSRRVIPDLSKKQILEWVDADRRRTGQWPTQDGGRVFDEPNITWGTVHQRLKRSDVIGTGPITLPRLLRRERNIWDYRGKPPLTEKLILGWADAHFRRTGRWPNVTSGRVHELPSEIWIVLDVYLRNGSRGLPGGTSLARMLAKRRGVPHWQDPPPLTKRMILKWADAHHKRTGKWPSVKFGPVVEATDISWSISWGTIGSRLARGGRGLPGGSTLSKFLAQHRGVRNRRDLPRLTQKQILAWADAHYKRTGHWPKAVSIRVHDARAETWAAVNYHLLRGSRGLPRGSSLAKLLIKRRGLRDRLNPPRLTHRQILRWADAHYEHFGDWPARESGRVNGSRHETWSRINDAMKDGRRGLRGGSSLPKLLAQHRRRRYRRKGLPLKRSQILDWARAHHERTGKPPTKNSGPVRDQPGEMWSAIDAALRTGSRALPGGSSLAQLLRKHYRQRFKAVGQPLTVKQILTWADEFRNRTGTWPTAKSAYTSPARQEKWSTIDLALREGYRGLPGGSSVYKLLFKHRFNR